MVGEGEGAGEIEEIQVRAGTLSAIAAQTVEAGKIFMGFMMGFNNKDGVKWPWGNPNQSNWYAEVRTDIFDLASAAPSGDYPEHQFVSFIGYQTDTGSELSGNTYYNSAGAHIDQAVIDEVDQYVTSTNINASVQAWGSDPAKKVWKIIVDPTDDIPVGTSLEYYVSTNGNTWQEVDSFAPTGTGPWSGFG